MQAQNGILPKLITKLESIENKISIENNIQYLFYMLLGFIGVARCAQGFIITNLLEYLIFLLILFTSYLLISFIKEATKILFLKKL
jgi:TM2 domain-containing membrane protein YozV